MKIYPGNHKIRQTDTVNLDTDIPLAYIDMEFLNYDIKLIPMIPYYDKKVVMPYTSFDSLKVCLFDENNSPADNTKILYRNGSKYYYMPEKAQSFNPQQFSYNVICKKNIKYENNSIYNIRVSCVDDADILYLSKNLIKIFGDAGDRGIAPKNLYINNKDTSIESLTSASFEESDFVFVESTDGVTYKKDWKANYNFYQNDLIEKDDSVYLCLIDHSSSLYFIKDTSNWRKVTNWSISTYYSAGDIVHNNNSIYKCTKEHMSNALSFNIDLLNNLWEKIEIRNTKIDIDYYKDNYANLWISSYFDAGIVDKSGTFSIKNPVLYKEPSMAFSKLYDKSTFSININTASADVFSNSDSSSCEPILIVENLKNSYIIKSHRSFLNKVFEGGQDDINFFYEVLMYAYSNSYVKSKSIKEWIADSVPDYIIVDGGITQKTKFTSDMQLDKIFGMNIEDISFSDIIIKSPNIVFTGIEDNYVIFQKRTDGEYKVFADPVKPEGSISVFTARQDIIYYKDFLYSIADNISNKITWVNNNSTIDIIVSDFKNSDKGISIKNPQKLSINLIEYIDGFISQISNASYFICCNNNIVSIIDKSKYKEGIILAEFQVSLVKSTSSIFDMRQKGGGLPEDKEPDYDLLDVGHIYGRPYRSSSTIVITLPKKLKKYEDLIKSSIDKHINGEEFPIFIFED